MKQLETQNEKLREAVVRYILSLGVSFSSFSWILIDCAFVEIFIKKLLKLPGTNLGMRNLVPELKVSENFFACKLIV